MKNEGLVSFEAAQSQVEFLKDSHFVKSFLISSKTNGNNWNVSWESIKRNGDKFIGKPGIAYHNCDSGTCHLDHVPLKEDDPYPNLLKDQEPYRVSTIRDVTYDDKTETAYAIHEIHDKDFSAKLKSGEIKYVSPSVFANEEYDLHFYVKDGKLHKTTENWNAAHLAWTEVPAYGEDAKLVDQCEGDCEAELAATLKPCYKGLYNELRQLNLAILQSRLKN